MEFLNIGWTEILLILVVAFIVLGPDRVTKVGQDLGTWIRKLNKSEAFRDVLQTTDEIRNYPRKILDEAMLDQPLRDIDFKPPIDPLTPSNGEDTVTQKRENSGDRP